MPRSNDWPPNGVEDQVQRSPGAMLSACRTRREVLAICLVLVAMSGCSSSSQDTNIASGQHGIQVMGLKSDRMQYHVAQQQASNWCWAASVQMVLSARGIHVSQQQIVANVSGGLVPDRPGSALDVLINLNGQMTDANGDDWRLEAIPGIGPPSFELMQQQFERDLPLIIGYSIPGQEVGHAAVITAVIYELRDDRPHILKILVRDPSPWLRGSGGKRELARAEFDRILTHTLVTPHPN